MSPREWRRIVEAAAKRHDGTVENRGSKLVIVLPTGGRVWCAATPARPAPDQVDRDIRRELARSRASAGGAEAAGRQSSRPGPPPGTPAARGSTPIRTATSSVPQTPRARAGRYDRRAGDRL